MANQAGYYARSARRQDKARPAPRRRLPKAVYDWREGPHAAPRTFFLLGSATALPQSRERHATQLSALSK